MTQNEKEKEINKGLRPIPRESISRVRGKFYLYQTGVRQIAKRVSLEIEENPREVRSIDN